MKKSGVQISLGALDKLNNITYISQITITGIVYMPDTLFRICPEGEHDWSEPQLVKFPPPMKGEGRKFPNVTRWECVCIACGSKRYREL